MEMKNKVMGIVGIVIAIVIIFLIIGNSAKQLTDSADSITDANNCSIGTDAANKALIYNITNKGCQNSSGGFAYTALQYDLPLDGLFSSSGVLMLILMASILLLVIGVVLKKAKQ